MHLFFINAIGHIHNFLHTTFMATVPGYLLTLLIATGGSTLVALWIREHFSKTALFLFGGR